MKKFLIVVDMQNDFIDGALGTKEALAIVPGVVEKIGTYDPDCVYATRDTHGEDYLKTREGEKLPVPHCIRGTEGWEVRREDGSIIFSSISCGSVPFYEARLELVLLGDLSPGFAARGGCLRHPRGIFCGWQCRRECGAGPCSHPEWP